MKIDITCEPPADIYRNRGMYMLIAGILLALSCSGVLLGVYLIVSEAPLNEYLETVALALFVAPTPIFFYFGEKVQAYKRLSADEGKEMVELGLQHPEIATYCALVAEAGRQPIMAEYEACKEWAEGVGRKSEPKK